MSDKETIFCDVYKEGTNDCCFTCKKSFVTMPWGDLKCEYKNHVLNKMPNGYVCRDFVPYVKTVVTENIEGGVINDRA